MMNLPNKKEVGKALKSYNKQRNKLEIKLTKNKFFLASLYAKDYLRLGKIIHKLEIINELLKDGDICLSDIENEGLDPYFFSLCCKHPFEYEKKYHLEHSIYLACAFDQLSSLTPKYTHKCLYGVMILYQLISLQKI